MSFCCEYSSRSAIGPARPIFDICLPRLRSHARQPRYPRLGPFQSPVFRESTGAVDESRVKARKKSMNR